MQRTWYCVVDSRSLQIVYSGQDPIEACRAAGVQDCMGEGDCFDEAYHAALHSAARIRTLQRVSAHAIH